MVQLSKQGICEAFLYDSSDIDKAVTRQGEERVS